MRETYQSLQNKLPWFLTISPNQITVLDDGIKIGPILFRLSNVPKNIYRFSNASLLLGTTLFYHITSAAADCNNPMQIGFTRTGVATNTSDSLENYVLYLPAPAENPAQNHGQYFTSSLEFYNQLQLQHKYQLKRVFDGKYYEIAYRLGIHKLAELSECGMPFNSTNVLNFKQTNSFLINYWVDPQNKELRAALSYRGILSNCSNAFVQCVEKVISQAFGYGPMPQEPNTWKLKAEMHSGHYNTTVDLSEFNTKTLAPIASSKSSPWFGNNISMWMIASTLFLSFLLILWLISYLRQPRAVAANLRHHGLFKIPPKHGPTFAERLDNIGIDPMKDPILKHAVCPITRAVINTPYIVPPAGISYEGTGLKAALSYQPNKDPTTKKKIDAKPARNFALENILEERVKQLEHEFNTNNSDIENAEKFQSTMRHRNKTRTSSD
jgi:hypothetical protein